LEDEAASVDAPSDDVSDRRHPIQVRCLGRFVVTSGGHELSPVLNDRSCHKAWELLALLAARPDGTMPKGQILAALWPDTDAEYAMQSLNQTGSRLRRSLRAQVPEVDDDVVCNGRDGTYRLDPQQVWSDAHRFATLCATAPKLSRERATAALHQARRLYRGELLADQAYKWPTERYAGAILRAHYVDLYRQATCRTARLLCEEGQTGRAVTLYKGLLKLEPTLEDVVRGLYRCYEQLGDLGSLLREDQELRQALREAFGDKGIDKGACEPSAPTRELFRQIRTGLKARARGRSSLHAPVLNGKVARG
jgi:two-component SAPR family response regulator